MPSEELVEVGGRWEVVRGSCLTEGVTREGDSWLCFTEVVNFPSRSMCKHRGDASGCQGGTLLSLRRVQLPDGTIAPAGHPVPHFEIPIDPGWAGDQTRSPPSPSRCK